MNKFFIWGTYIAFYFFQFILRSSFGIFANNLRLDTNISMTEFSIISSGYYIAYCLFQIPFGVMLDRLGDRKVFFMSTIICLLGSIIFYFSNSVKSYFVARFLLGMGASSVFIGCTLVTKKIFKSSSNMLKISLGLIPAFGKLGGVFSTLMIPLILLKFSWKNSFLIILTGLFIIFALMLYFFKCYNQNLKDKKFEDYKDVFSENEKDHKNLFENLFLIISTPQFWIISIYASLTYLPISVFSDIWGVMFTQEYYGISDKLASKYISILYFGATVGTPIASLFLLKFNRKIVFLITNIFNILGFIHLIFKLNVFPLYSVFLIIGLSYGSHAFLFLYSKTMFPQAIGTSNGAINAINMLGGIIVQLLIGYFFEYLINNMHLSRIIAFKFFINIELQF